MHPVHVAFLLGHVSPVEMSSVKYSSSVCARIRARAQRLVLQNMPRNMIGTNNIFLLLDLVI